MKAPAWAAAGAATAAGAWHLLRNQTPPSFDDAWYLEVSFRLFHALPDPAAFARQYAGAFRFKAPLLSLTPLPLYAVLGPSERLAPWACLAALAATCASVRAAALRLWPEHPRREEIAALAAATTALTPLLYGLSRSFLVEPLLTALVAASMARVAGAGRPGRGEGVRLGALLGLGLLAKVLFPAYVALPAWLNRKELAPRARTALLVGGAVAATWYAFNLPYVLGFAWSAAFGRIARDYAAAGFWSGLFSSPSRLIGDALSWPFAAAGAGVIAAAATARGARLDSGVRLALAWAAPLLALPFAVNTEVRFAAPALPALALLVARAAASFDSPAARRAAAAVVLGAGGLVFVQQTFLLPPSEALPYCGAPSRDPGWDRSALLDALSRTAGPGSTAALALEHRRLNANNLSSLAARRGLPFRVVSLGYAQPSAEGALIRLKDANVDHLVLVDGVPAGELPAFLNKANVGVAEAIRSGRLPADPAGIVEVAPGVRASIYRLRRGM